MSRPDRPVALNESTVEGTSGPAPRPFPRGPLDLRPVPKDAYEVVGELGRGGMGQILIARDLRLRRTVAIKVLFEDDDTVELRFRREAELTARLDHPSIVPIHEAGTWHNGRPYYAMKHIHGRSLSEAIEGAGGMAARLGLVPAVIAVAEAVAYAHARGIIHRDLKPANVVVGPFGETYVIDWGIAKDMAAPDEAVSTTGPYRAPAAPPDDALTATGDVLGTPIYMSPEQAAGEPADERSDVFSLGVVLYAVIAGRHPYDQPRRDPQTGQPILGEPVPLARRTPDAPPELLAIVSKAMSPTPADRYPSARELADDLRRFQQGQLVGAHRYTAFEILRRWARRHRGLLILGALAGLSLAVIGALALRQVLAARARADEARAVAERRRAGAEDLLSFLLGDLRTRLSSLGRLDLLSDVAARVEGYYDREADAGAEASQRRATALSLLAEVQLARGELESARTTSRRAEARWAALAEAAPADPGPRFGRAEVLGRLGDIYFEQGELAAAVEAQDQACALLEPLVASRPGVVLWQRGLAVAYTKRGFTRHRMGRRPEALADFALARVLLEPLVAAEPKNGRLWRDLAIAWSRTGDLHWQVGEPRPAIEAYRKTEEVIARGVAVAPRDAHVLSMQATAKTDLGEALVQEGDLAGARARFAAARQIYETLIALEPSSTDWRRNYMFLHTDEGKLELAAGDAKTALARFERCAEIGRELLARQPDNRLWEFDLGVCHERVGQALKALGRLGDAAAAYRRALEVRERLAAADPENLQWLQAVYVAHYYLGDLLAEAGDRKGALAEQLAAMAGAEKVAARDPATPAWRFDVAELAGLSAGLTPDPAEARRLYDKALAIYAAAGTLEPDKEELRKRYAAARSRM